MCSSTSLTTIGLFTLNSSYSPIPLESSTTSGKLSSLENSQSSPETSAKSRSPELDPRSAGQKILRLLSQKVRNAKIVERFRQTILAQRIERAPEKSSFTVEKVPSSQYPAIRRIITSWIDEIDALKSSEGITEPDRARLSDSEGIISMIEPELIPGGEEHSRSIGKPNPTIFLVAKNPITENIEAIACVIEPYQPISGSFKAHYEINYLATAPKNLRLSFQTTCISGAATALIENIAYRALRHTAEKKISVYSLPGAHDFYKRLRFAEFKGKGQFNLSGNNLLEFLSRFGGVSLGSSL